MTATKACLMLALASTEAFSPIGNQPSLSVTKSSYSGRLVARGSSSRRNDRFPILNDGILVEPMDGDTHEEPSMEHLVPVSPTQDFNQGGIEFDMEIYPTTSNINSIDEESSGEEIFLASMDFSKPLEETMDDVTNENLSFVLSAASQAADAALEKSESSFTDEVELEESVPLRLVDAGNCDVVTNEEHEHVNAVLEASLEAVEAAEASMPNVLYEQLDFPITPDNDFEGSQNTLKTIDEPMVLDDLPEILPASEVVGEPITAPKIEAPGVRKILKFAVPAIGVWLCGPLLSLIDTSAVGLLSGTTQQAALNPAVAVTDYAALLIAFMYTATTNLVAAAQESDRTLDGKPATTKTMVGAMQLSTYVGAGLGAILFIFARPLLNAIIGNGSISPAVFSAAMKYVRIRALGMPAAAIIGSAQAACLGMQDIRSPLYVLATAALVNFVGDSVFVGSKHALIGGAAGAAWATVFSQYAAVAIFVKWLCSKPGASKKPHVVNLSKQILEITGKPASEGADRRRGFREALASFGRPTRKIEKSIKLRTFLKRVSERFPFGRAATPGAKGSGDSTVSVRGFLKDRFSMRDLFKFPGKEIRADFMPYLLPVTTTQVGRVSGYVAMSHVVASSLGTVSMAAQQVVVSLFYCLCPIADSLSLTAQSFLPSISEKAASPEKAAAMKKTLVNFFKAGGVFGAAMVAAVCTIPLLSGFFTADPQVVGLVNSVVPLLLAFFGVHGVMCSAEGLLLGQKDLNFLGRMYAAYFAAVPYLMLRVKRAALAGRGAANLMSVWKVFVGYQMVRTVAWVGRSLMLQHRTDSEAARQERLELEQQKQQLLQNSSIGLAP